MSIIHQLLTDHIDVWTTADTAKKTGRGRISNNAASVYGVRKLRELILELAVHGKLVPQNINDEPASELVKKIHSQKKNLISAGKIKQLKPPLVENKVTPFKIPKSWEWIKLADLGIIVGGGTPKSDDSECWDNQGIPWLTPADLYGLKEKYIGRGRRDISDKGLKTSSAQLLPKGTVLFSSRAPIGYVAIAKNTLTTNQGFKSCIPFINEMTDYLYWYLKRSAKEIDSLASGTTFKEISGAGMAQIFVPVPPLSEQYHIVTKIEELMSLCEQVEAHHTNATGAHEKLVNHFLDILTQSKGTEEFIQNWKRISEHFNTLFTTETSIDALKQTLLQLAVMGKLVPQDLNDEPASEILKRIQNEKTKLITKGKVKKDKLLEAIKPEEKAFELPKGWQWVKCYDICLKITDGEHATPQRSESGYYLLSARNITNNGIILNDVDYVPLDEFKRIRNRCDPNIGDILISCSGSVGRACLVDKDHAYSMVRSAAMIRPYPRWILNEYLVLLLRSPYLQTQMKQRSKQSAQANLFLGSISNLVLIIPPELEQHRIVNKFNELMVLCDRLKAKVIEASEIQQKLADVIIEYSLK